MGGRENGDWSNYQERLHRVIEYIHDHLDEHLDLNRLAEIACLSPYHWHRIYHAMLGETVAMTVRRLRIHRAAADLVNTRRSIREIARAHGFSSVQTFARAFRCAFGIAPSNYRSRGTVAPPHFVGKDNLVEMYEVQLLELDALTLLATPHIGSYLEIGRAFDHLFGWLAARNAISPGMRPIAVYYDDPAAKREQELRSSAGVLLPREVKMESPFELIHLEAGPHAVLRHVGPYANLGKAYQWLYGQWLPQSGREAADRPVFEEYLNTPRDTAPPDLITDICLPLRGVDR